MAKAKKPQKKSKPQKQVDTQENENFRGIVRIAGKDVNGEITLRRSLSLVRGISHTTASVASKVLEKELSLDPHGRVGDLTEQQIENIDKILYNLHKYDVPSYLLNRCRDFKSGTNKHVIMNDLIFELTQDIDREKKMQTWRGYRHHYGQKVRGQKTRNTGRSGMAVGVLRKAIIAAQGGAKPAAAAAAAPAKAEKEKKEKK